MVATGEDEDGGISGTHLAVPAVVEPLPLVAVVIGVHEDAVTTRAVLVPLAPEHVAVCVVELALAVLLGRLPITHIPDTHVAHGSGQASGWRGARGAARSRP